VSDPGVRGALLDDSLIFEYVDRSKIERLMSRPRLPNSESKFLFNFVNGKLFLDEFGG